MYERGDLRLSPPCDNKKVAEGDCYEHTHPVDSRGADYSCLHAVVYLPHSCNEWVIGGPEQIRDLIEDLTSALVSLGGAQ